MLMIFAKAATEAGLETLGIQIMFQSLMADGMMFA